MKPVPPLSTFGSLLYFIVSALVFRLCVYNLMPYLLLHQVPAFWSFMASYSVLLLLFIIATFVMVYREGNLPYWRQRLRLGKLGGKAVLWCLLLFVVSFLITGALLPSAQYIASMPAYAPPSFLPSILNPNAAIPGAGLTEFMGVPLKGAYWIIPVYFVFLTVLNIGGEELWFRGYLLPRQQLVWGRLTWVIHGVLWCLFHTPVYPWTVLYLLPTTLAVSYAAQRFQNTWAGFIIHYAGNGILALLPIVMGVVE